MLILIDREGVNQMLYRTESREHGDLRRYYTASAPARGIVVCRNNLDLKSLIGQVVDATVGNEKGWRDFVRGGNEGQLHTKVTIFRTATGRSGHDGTLGSILSKAPKDTTD